MWDRAGAVYTDVYREIQRDTESYGRTYASILSYVRSVECWKMCTTKRLMYLKVLLQGPHGSLKSLKVFKNMKSMKSL